jgi:hypothetical protein
MVNDGANLIGATRGLQLSRAKGRLSELAKNVRHLSRRLTVRKQQKGGTQINDRDLLKYPLYETSEQPFSNGLAMAF